MKISVGGAADARPWEVCSDGVGSAPRFRKQKVHAGRLSATERRATALDASIDGVLIEASACASDRLRLTWPGFSAATLSPLANAIPLLLGVLTFAATLTTPSAFILSAIVVLPIAFRIFVVVQEMADAEDRSSRPSFPTTPDEELPLYSVIVPLRGEARVVDQLLSGIERLDYPAEKLDVVIAVEANDDATRAAITARNHRVPITVIPVPAIGPQTKPKALNVALPFARGVFTVIYDAEDRPEQDQLRLALKAFRSAGSDLACVQARLCVDTETSWLACYFTAEYAGHFDVFLPRLAALGLPLPLGGSSNHFRTATLREVGGWDAHNVTEDADLGMRLARFGYRSEVIDSATYEEAPADACRWLGQRSRWFKGWMQTWLVHMREPRRLFRELGCRGFLTFQLIVGGNALVALAHPFLMAGPIWRLIAQSFQGYDSATIIIQTAHFLLTAAIGYSVSARLGWLGLSRRRVSNKVSILMWTPVHWLLLSLAAWCAAIELITKPYFWKKTEHGLAKNLRISAHVTRSLLELERHLSELKRSGQLPQIWNDATDSAANRRRHLQGAA